MKFIRKNTLLDCSILQSICVIRCILRNRWGENKPYRPDYRLSYLHNLPPDEPIDCIGCRYIFPLAKLAMNLR